MLMGLCNGGVNAHTGIKCFYALSQGMDSVLCIYNNTHSHTHTLECSYLAFKYHLPAHTHTHSLIHSEKELHPHYIAKTGKPLR